ncbi:iron-sulfur cluster assembly 1 homolog, mitochondrial-like isoform X3 [Falco rusticolus]|uniref:iron-sulfur cluster assembly 1 homolog, mitochondrial-like isoform X3 n=1 Tax=Falco rusticolus TaxID=120794 RepID=UPI0018869CD5|nr:iron-sulfur cluster assembly 1 homolog, mitochondrial-like isoform X3 [Falco rusticolus]XP_055556325.1 iron-sulfur cluster assembly 1 homolog, mitochondrial-like isoform X2 [Falco cherrug]
MARLLLGNSRGRRQGCCWLPIMGCCPMGVGAGSVLCVVASCRLCLGQMGEEGAEMVMASSVVRATVRATPSAAQKIKHLLKDKPEHVGVKVGVRTRGCNGLSYTLEYTKSKGDSDEDVVQDGIRIFIEKKAQLTLLRTEMDYVEDKLFSEFVFNNPNIKGTCGCGESFNV